MSVSSNICEIKNATNDPLAFVVTDSDKKNQAVVQMAPETSITLPGECGKFGLVGVWPSSSIMISRPQLTELSRVGGINITPTTQLVRNGDDLVVRNTGEAVPAPTNPMSEFLNLSNDYVLVSGNLSASSVIAPVLLGKGGAFDMSPPPTTANQESRGNEVAINVTVGRAYFILTDKQIEALHGNSSVALGSIREGGLLFTFVLTRPRPNQLLISKTRGVDGTQPMAGLAAVAGGPGPAPASAPGSDTIIVRPTIQTGINLPSVIGLSVTAFIFLVLFIVFLSLYLTKTCFKKAA